MALGEFEQALLFALVRLDGEGHGVAIADEIARRTGRQPSPGAVYTALDRLAGKGLVDAWIGDSSPDRGGRRRKVYRMRVEGARELRASYEALRSLASGMRGRLDALAEEGP